MEHLTDTISMKLWQAFVLLGASGFAVGTLLSKATTALGF